MRFVFCYSCRTAVQIGGDQQEIQSLIGDEDSTYPCVAPLCEGRMKVVPVGRLPFGCTIVELPVRSFFRAYHGFGTGIGAPASLKRLRELLLSQKIVDIKAEPVGQPERVIVREIVLESGVRLHLEASAKGACVYYIEEPGPSCVEVVEDELSADAVAQGSVTDREEAGRVTQGVLDHAESGISPGGGAARADELPNAGAVPAVPASGGVSAGGDAGVQAAGAGEGMRLRADH